MTRGCSRWLAILGFSILITGSIGCSDSLLVDPHGPYLIGDLGEFPVDHAMSTPPTANNPFQGAMGPMDPGLTSTAHPVLFLAPTILDGLRQRAQAGDAGWRSLESYCNARIGANVEWPDGADYPNGVGIGEGYQGSGYFNPLINMSLCYQIVRLSNPTVASQYAATAIDVLTKMSETSGSHAVPPLRDSGFGIRFFGVGMAIAYDWVHDAMTTEQRERVYGALNLWISTFDTQGFGRKHPQGNYFAGYYAAKGLAALATEGDNPQAATQWGDWLNRLHNQMVAPYYQAYLRGGGWPEGWNYGPTATLNMWWPILGARTAKGLDLVAQAGKQHDFPIGQGLHLVYFAWPNRRTLDDRAIQYQSDNPSRTPSYLYTSIAGLLGIWQARSAPLFHRFARQVRATGQDKAELWQEFLFWNENATEEDIESLPLSYLAEGANTAAMRSSWATDAVWATFTSSPYLNNSESGEEYWDQGSLVILRGTKQLLVNSVGALSRNTPGTSDGGNYFDSIYAEVSQGNRTIFNIFYVNSPSPYGQASRGPTEAHTRISRYEEGGKYVLVRGAGLEEMYRRSGSPAVTGWNRDVVYVRPERFVVLDRTQIAQASMDQWMSFHLGGRPVEVSTDQSGAHRFDVGSGGTYAGTMTTLFPAGARTQVVSLFGRDKIFRVEIRPQGTPIGERWMTAFDAATSAGGAAATKRISTADSNVTAGDIIGVYFAGTTPSVVIASRTGAMLSGEIAYTVPAGAAYHVITDLPPSTSYTIESTGTGTGTRTVRVVPGPGDSTSSAGGVLAFDLP